VRFRRPQGCSPGHQAILAVLPETPQLPDYFVEAGYEEEVMGARSAIRNGDGESLRAAISERMASDVALFGTKAEVLEKAEAWAAAGITQLVLDSTSTTGDHLKAAYEVIDAFT
jgi:alkanesulfonate monooxygenase SsuD/methylene tetrahydromethanopterin reductase-like flavin-dependent oxidoreductase (luciferase family)